MKKLVFIFSGIILLLSSFSQTRGSTSVKAFYEIGSPLFEKITLQLDPKYYKEKNFVIIAKNVSDVNCYIQSATLDGKPLNMPWFYYKDLIDRGTLLLQCTKTKYTVGKQT